MLKALFARDLLDALEVLDGLDLELESCVLVDDDHGVGVQLEAGERPHVVHSLLDTLLQSKCFACSQDDDDDLSSLENSLNTDRQRHSRDLTQVIVEEAGVGQDGIIRQGLDAGSAGETGSGLVERNVSVLANAGHEEVDASRGLDGFLVGDALGLGVNGVAVENVHVGRVDVYVGEEVLPHKGMV